MNALSFASSLIDILVLAVTVGAMIGWIIAPDQTVVAAALKICELLS